MQGLLASFMLAFCPAAFYAKFALCALCPMLVSDALLVSCLLCVLCPMLLTLMRFVACQTNYNTLLLFSYFGTHVGPAAFYADLHTLISACQTNCSLTNLARRHDSQNSRNFRPSSPLQWEKCHVAEIMRMRVFHRVKMADCLYAYCAGSAQISATEHIQKKTARLN